MNRVLPAAIRAGSPVVLVLLLLLAAPCAAAAGEPVVAIRVAYSAPTACPDRDVLLAHVYARTPRARSAGLDEPARELEIHVDAQKGGYRGRLVVPASADSARQEREVAGAACDEVVEALGFFIALAIDPTASQPPAPAPAPAPGVPVPLTAPAPRPRPAPAPAPVRSAPRTTGASPWHLGGGTGAALVSGVASTVRFANRFFVELSHRPRGSHGATAADSPYLSPLLSISAMTTATETSATRLGAIALRWQALTATGCPIRLPLASSVTARPCIDLEVGHLQGDGVAIVHATANDAPWLALGLDGKIELELSPVFLQVSAGVAFPLSRPRFRYTSGTLAFETAGAGGRGSLALGLRF